MSQAIALLGIFLPGLCYWAWFGDEKDDAGEALAAIFGVSLSFTALAALFGFLLRLPFGPNKQFAYWLGFGLLSLLGLVFNRKRLKPGWGLALALIGLAGLLAWRFWQAEELVLPNWVDSLHHSLIVRKMVEARGLSASLEPYLPGNFYYHYGFHAFTALYALFSGEFAPFAVLFLGQILSVGVSLSVYAFAKTLTGSWKIALLAGLLTAFSTKMPGYYLSWGRYTLLAGILLMPLAMSFGLKVLRGDGKPGRLAGLALLTAGTLLTHYFNAFLLAIFFVLLGLVWLAKGRADKKLAWGQFIRLLLPVLFGLLLVSPWYWRIYAYSGNRTAVSLSLVSLAAERQDQWEYLGYVLGGQLNYLLAIMAGAGALWYLLKARHLSFVFWSLLVGLLSLPIGLQISNFRYDYFALIVFFPISVLAASFLVRLVDYFRESSPAGWLRKVPIALLLLSALGLLGYGGWTNQSAVNPSTIMADQDDLEALDWIKGHLPTEARFFINTAPWGFGIYRGVDGGAWITPYTGAWSIVPTDFYPFGDDLTFSEHTREIGVKANAVTSCEMLAQTAEELALDFAYLKEGYGSLSAQTLLSCGQYHRIYSGGSVSLWNIAVAGP